MDKHSLKVDVTFKTAQRIFPLRHPAHVAKAAATVDVLSGDTEETIAALADQIIPEFSQ